MSIYDWGTIRTQKFTVDFESVNPELLVSIYGKDYKPANPRASVVLNMGEVVEGVITGGAEKGCADNVVEYEFNFTPDDPQDLINKLDMANYEREMYEEGWGWQ